MSDPIRLRAFISQLQNALGWQVKVEKEATDAKQYTVTIKFKLTFRGKVWPDIVRSFDYRRVVYEMVKNELDKLLDREREDLARASRASRTPGATT